MSAFVWQLLPFSLPSWRTKNTDICVFLHFYTADTRPSRGQEDGSSWSFVSLLTWCLPSAGETFFWETLHPSKVNNTAAYAGPKDNFVKGENAATQGESTHQLEHVPDLPCCWTWITFHTTLAPIPVCLVQEYC